MSGGQTSVLKPALNNVASVGSGDTGNDTEINGPSIDLEGVTGRRFRSVRVAIHYRSVVTTAETFRLASNLQHSTASGGTYADLGTAPSNHTQTTTGTNNGLMEYEQDLSGASRYIRVQATPTFFTGTGDPATGTGGSVLYGGVAVLQDANRLPASG